jgi:hypothetical protein
MRRHNPGRILAIDPNARGFGFVVFEGPDRLIDWGLRDIRTDKEQRTIERVGRLFALYQPTSLVTEDADAPGSRRGPTARLVIRSIHDLARSHSLDVHRVPRRRVYEVFRDVGASNKHTIACAIASRFPELEPHRPRFRKPWMSEDQRMAIFDAAAFALSAFAIPRQTSRRAPSARGQG